MNHETTDSFWKYYDSLPTRIQEIADQNFDRLKNNPQHPSLHFKQVGQFYSVRVGLRYRALALQSDEVFIWFWIGTHAEYTGRIKR